MKAGVLLLILMLSAAQSFSAAASQKETDDFKKAFSTKLSSINPAFKIESVTPSAMPLLYEVQVIDGPLLYVHASGDYMLAGNLFSLTGDEIENLTEKRANDARKVLMGEVKKAKGIVFSPKPPEKIKANIYVFTDVDCGYCRKLHQEVSKLNEAGIAVHYLAFPRAGVGSASYKKIATAWCAKNPNEVMNKLKNRQSVDIIACENPVAVQYELGKKMGVNGTPAILLEDGTLIPGYRPAEDLIKIILKK